MSVNKCASDDIEQILPPGNAVNEEVCANKMAYPEIQRMFGFLQIECEAALDYFNQRWHKIKSQLPVKFSQ